MQEEGKNVKQNHAPPTLLFNLYCRLHAGFEISYEVWSRRSRLTPVLLVVLFLCFDLYTRLQCIIRGKLCRFSSNPRYIFI